MGTTLVVVLLAVCVFPTQMTGTAGALYCVGDRYSRCVGWSFLWLRGVFDRVHQRLSRRAALTRDKHLSKEVEQITLPYPPPIKIDLNNS